MAKNLLIVESPAKAKTINKYLGKDFFVLASYGHVRDLVPKEGAVDTENQFSMRYQLVEKNEGHIEAIAKAAKQAQALYLATDLDREGEAISWHIAEILKERGLLEGKTLHRVTFSEITPKAIQEAIEHPRKISTDLVNAQQARRALDHLVGFNLSPILWRKVQPGLSAGRVQSPALCMIVQREDEIEQFKAEEYWTIESNCSQKTQAFSAKLTRFNNAKVEQFSFRNQSHAEAARSTIEQAAGGSLLVSEVTHKQRQRRPAPPLITSTLQQEAARKLGFETKKTMRVAQTLYEGVALGNEGSVGLITYMRTDSTHLGNDAVDEIRQVILQRYGQKALPEKPNIYRPKSKNAQEAHEAIRPTSALRLPESVASFLTPDQAKLYELIWRRTVACQMTPALLNTVSVDLAAGTDHSFRVSGTTVVEPGFLTVYEEGKDQRTEEDEEEGRRLPLMNKGDQIALHSITADQHFTEPPPRYSEASLVKTLEEYGIGRPSTYASIIQTLLSREYVRIESRRFFATDVGRVVAKFLSNHFTQYVDYEFTAKLEDELDAVSRGEEDWVPLLHKFWTPFKNQVLEKTEVVTRDEVKNSRVLGADPESGKPITVRLGRNGAFVQMGLKEDGDKPRYAPLKPGQSLFTLTMADALELFKLPRTLGVNEQGESVIASIGQFGPYIKIGSVYASLKKEDDPYTIELPRALEVMKEKLEIAANRVIARFEDLNIEIINTRFGPYIIGEEKRCKVPKDRDPKSLSGDECAALLAAAPFKPRRGGFTKAKKAAEKPTKAKKTAQPKADKAQSSAVKKTVKKTSAAKPKTKAVKKGSKKAKPKTA
jgi:DNA topoisomerase-1